MHEKTLECCSSIFSLLDSYERDTDLHLVTFGNKANTHFPQNAKLLL